MRSDEEILARYHAVKDDDLLGFKAEVLLQALSREGAKSKPGAPFNDWRETTNETLQRDLANYMQFAWDKARNHRGISASRSVDKITEMAWLLGRDDVVDAMSTAGYENYGAPKLAAACLLLGLPVPDSNRLRNMIAGQPCVAGCAEGCGS